MCLHTYLGEFKTFKCEFALFSLFPYGFPLLILLTKQQQSMIHKAQITSSSSYHTILEQVLTKTVHIRQFIATCWHIIFSEHRLYGVLHHLSRFLAPSAPTKNALFLSRHVSFTEYNNVTIAISSRRVSANQKQNHTHT